MEKEDDEIAEAEHQSTEDNSVQRRPVDDNKHHFKACRCVGDFVYLEFKISVFKGIRFLKESKDENSANSTLNRNIFDYISHFRIILFSLLNFLTFL